MKDFLTEADAKKRWCPYVQIAKGTNRAADDVDVDCIASGCMAWRWSHQDTGVSAAPTGFCGAFGLPKYV